MLTLPAEEREALWERVIRRVEEYVRSVDEGSVSIASDPAQLRAILEPMDFSSAMTPQDAVDFVADGLWRHQVHTSHRQYYGLFNPNPTTMGIAADLLAAAFNPQLAVWGHSPFACEVERHLVSSIASRFGYEPATVGGSFTSGGAEANHTGLLAALNRAFPSYVSDGTRGLGGQPVFYVSAESHHSLAKAARMCGIGSEAVVQIPLDGDYLMDAAALERQLAQDRAQGRLPFMVVATMGTTNAGFLDPIDAIIEVARAESLWVHADAAWGGAAALVPELRPSLGNIQAADSITFDAHKWLSVPMGAGMFFTRHREILERAFGVDTQYMPVAGLEEIVEPHRTTMQWSRRFIGLKVFLSLLVAGWDGYEATLRHQTRMGNLLRDKLVADDWRIVGHTPLPTVCFEDGLDGASNTQERMAEIAADLVGAGTAWLSTTRLGGVRPVLRATITNYRTQPEDLDGLVEALGRARSDSSSDQTTRT